MEIISLLNNKKFTQCMRNNDFDPNSLSDINSKNSKGLTALHIVCMNLETFSSDNTVETLLWSGADPNSRDITGWTPLHYALGGRDSLATVKLLLRSSNGANPNAKTPITDLTPLHVASCFLNKSGTDSLVIFELLLRNGADPNAKENGIYPNAKEKDIFTPLHYLSLHERENTYMEVAKLLLQYNATPIDNKTRILKLGIDIEKFVEANKRLQQRILLLESEED